MQLPNCKCHAITSALIRQQQLREFRSRGSQQRPEHISVQQWRIISTWYPGVVRQIYCPVTWDAKQSPAEKWTFYACLFLWQKSVFPISILTQKKCFSIISSVCWIFLFMKHGDVHFRFLLLAGDGGGNLLKHNCRIIDSQHLHFDFFQYVCVSM